MEKMNNRQMALIIALVIALITTGIFIFNNRSLKMGLKKEKISSESLLSEKLNLDKSLEKLRTELAELKGQNKQLDSRLVAINSELGDKEAQLKKAIADNSSLRVVRARVNELETLTNKLNEEISALKSEANQQKDRHTSEKQQLGNELDILKKENTQLLTTNTILKAMAGNNYHLETVRGKNDKLTVKARRTQKLVFSFDLPANIATNLQFQVDCPEGKVYKSKDNQSASIKEINSSRNFFASITDIQAVDTKTIEMIYIPEDKLKKGDYEFKVFNDGKYIGSNKFSLR